MTPRSLWLVRLALWACPARFRRAYGPEVVRTVIDRCRHGGEPAGRVVAREVVDVAMAASRMRWEDPVNRTALLAVAAAALTVAALVRGSLVLGPIAVIVVVAALVRNGRRRAAHPVDSAPQRWRPLLAGVGLCAAAVAIPVVDGGELSEPWWLVAAALLLGGLIVGFFGLFSAARQPPSPAA
jgi:hypothetical protein